MPGIDRIAIYARVSTKDKGQDPENQLQQLREFAQAQGWKIVREYLDHVSGKTSDRAQFQQLFADASRRPFDLVLFWSLNRFSSEGALETLKHLERLAQYRVGYRSYSEQYLDSCGIFKDAVLSIIATVAKQERMKIRPHQSRPGTSPLRRPYRRPVRALCWTETGCLEWTRTDTASRKSPAKWVAPRYPFRVFCEGSGSSCQGRT